MLLNTTLSNMTHTNRWCNIDYETVNAARLYTVIMCSICSFTGNLLVILTVYRNKNLRTSTNYFIVSMSVSDILFPLMILLRDYLLVVDRNHLFLPKLVGEVICRLMSFMCEVSYSVSMLTLVAITVYRFSAVVFPIRARVQNKKKRLLVLLLTWVISVVMFSPGLVNSMYRIQDKTCILALYTEQSRIWFLALRILLLFLPLLIMLVLYPLIIIRLRQHNVPGNVNSLQAVIRRKKRNFRLTIMFIVITVAFLLSWVPYSMSWVILVTFVSLDWCALYFVLDITQFNVLVFVAFYPVIYFIFCSSFRQGFKNIFLSFCSSRRRPQVPTADNFN